MVSVALHIPVEVTLTCTVEFMVVGTGEKERNVCCIQLIQPVYVAVDTGEKERNVCCIQLILPVYVAVDTGEKERNVCCIQLILPVSVAVDVSALMFKECFFYCNIY